MQLKKFLHYLAIRKKDKNYKKKGMKMDKNKKEIFYEELSLPQLKTKDLILLDLTDKPFLIIYSFIFIFGIVLTILSI